MHRRSFFGLALSSAALALPRPARAAEEALPFALKPCTTSFARRAPFVVVHEAVLPARPEEVFDALAAPEPWPQWLPLIDSVRYRSQEPHQAGVERDVSTTFGVLREVFLHWDRGERFAFFVRESTSPVPHRFLEDYQLRPVAGGRTRLTWILAFETTPLYFAAGPLFAALFEAIGPSCMDDLARVLRERAGRLPPA